jgi:hypothetical protein
VILKHIHGMNIFNWCTKPSNDGIDDDNNFNFSKMIDKYSLSHQDNILYSLLVVQLSYYPRRFFENYIDKILKKSPLIKPRLSDVSTDSFVELNMYSNCSCGGNETSRTHYDCDPMDVVPFSSIFKEYVDNKIINNELKNSVEIVRITQHDKYRFRLLIYNSIPKKTIYILPQLEIFNGTARDVLSDEIMAKLVKNKQFVLYFTSNSLDPLEKVVVSHLYSSYISINIALFLQKVYTTNILLYMFHPLMTKTKYLVKLFESQIKYDIFSVDIYNNIPSLLHKKIIWIPENSMRKYDNEYTCDSILCGKEHKINKKKNIRSYIYTLYDYLN